MLQSIMWERVSLPPPPPTHDMHTHNMFFHLAVGFVLFLMGEEYNVCSVDGDLSRTPTRPGYWSAMQMIVSVYKGGQ